MLTRTTRRGVKVSPRELGPEGKEVTAPNDAVRPNPIPKQVKGSSFGRSHEEYRREILSRRRQAGEPVRDVDGKKGKKENTEQSTADGPQPQPRTAKTKQILKQAL